MVGSIAHAAAVILLGALWVLAGDALLPRAARRAEPMLRTATALAVGVGATSILLTVLGMFGLLGRAAAWGVEVLVAVLAAASLRRELSYWRDVARRSRAASGAHPLVAALIAAIVGGSLVATLAPPSSMDATVYHMTAARKFLVTGSWAGLDGIMSGHYPKYLEMIFALGMGLWDDVLAALCHWVLGLGAALTAAAWGRRLSAPPSLAALLSVATGVYVWESSSSFVDLGLASFGCLALLWATAPGEGLATAALAGLLGGLAAGTKLTGAVFAALAAVMAAASVWSDRREAVRRFSVVAGVAAALAVPWYLRSFVETGNPFFPLGNKLLGLPVHEFFPYGYGRDLLHLVTSPFDLAWRGEAFDKGWCLGPAFLAFVPLGIVAGRREAMVRRAAVVVAVWWIVWFYGSPQARLLFPMLPIAAALAARGLAAARARGARFLTTAALVPVALNVTLALGIAAQSARTALPFVVGKESRDQYLARMSLHYPAYAAVRRILPEGHIGVVGCDNLYYLLSPYAEFASGMSPAERTRRGLTHVLRIFRCEDAPAGWRTGALWADDYYALASRTAGGRGEHYCARLETSESFAREQATW